ncbi:glucosamine inositolphosphorylceramide transferase family protein [Oharaeibacter diazotrophicus]|uniref:Glucosamine inositolphosphorylceramide transferase 1 N-terminal domain-containing protein n=3 Tax=Oharaeibacter diazotrophicus TaxID=1920512 RepID=A0A4R6R875_9HYPH|nr:hypothetical protein [Oharaeibacter diazotrophicus]TDP81965.1 hypothetical protein EDD54_4226 [Oharaeibacter diazotrophicus]BBE73597.1 hypothetical protein OHA_1_03211 [Pleomorphomonas sp. SM30]GLS75387.1 hypothetical protein GCM10007904_07220 [Oharaeibacter diazotrophicus]
MSFALVLPSPAAMVWHRAAVDAVAAATGEAVQVVRVAAPPLPTPVRLLIELERLVRGVRPGHPALPDPAPPAGEAAVAAGRLAIDLAAGPATGRRLVLRCDGLPVDLGAAAAMTAGTTPVLTLDLEDGTERRRLVAWAVAVENRSVFVAGLSNIYGRAIDLVARAARQVAAGRPAEAIDLGPVATPGPAVRAGSAAGFMAASIANVATRRLGRMLRLKPEWHVGVRPDDGSDGIPDLAGRPFRLIPDDGARFLADPFPAARDGRRVVFVEELPFSTGKGVISSVEIAADGTPGALRPVLELDCHLSYPYLLEEDGTLYMVPETSGRGTVELWRCIDFPGRWELDTVLISGCDLSDASPMRDGEGWAMFANGRARWCSTWDAVELWRAPALRGPWRRCGDGPFLVDVRTARPAGAPFHVGGRVVRPVQDSSERYGGALAFAAMDDLGARPAQTVVRRVRPAAPLLGLHTWNRGGGLEVVDVFGPRIRGPVVVARPD